MRNFFLLSLAGFSLAFADGKPNAANKVLPILGTEQEIASFFPKTVEEIESKKNQWIKDFQDNLHQLLMQKNHTYNRTVRLFDITYGKIALGASLMECITHVYPQAEMRKAAQEASIDLKKEMTASFYEHPEIYTILSDVPEKHLSNKQRYFLEETKADLMRMGLGLSSEKRQKAKRLNDELASLGERFAENIRENRSTVLVTKEELAGMEENFIDSLQQDASGNYILTMDYPIVYPILSYCSVEKTRKRLFTTFAQRGYPQNIQVLEGMIQKREELAKILDFSSYAEYELSGEMVQTPERAKAFLDEMAEVLKKKQREEFATLTKDLPEGVVLNKEGQMQPWDISYAINSYIKKHYDIDTEAVKEYFPLESTIKGLLNVYQQFFAIKIEEISNAGLWSDEVRVLKILDPTAKQVYGYILLDLFPREGKYSHACEGTLIPAVNIGKQKIPFLGYVICNFPRETSKTPSLLTHNNMTTFFHEFGHALHDVLGRTDLISTAGTSTKRDFVELPSQLLEEWLWDSEILQMCSSHYKTNEKIPQELIDKMVAAKNAFSGSFNMRQIMLSNYSLAIFSSKDVGIQKLWRSLNASYRSEVALSMDDYFYLSFGHLDGYGARYYGYLWSKVFALDVFDVIKKGGLLNPQVGKRYVKEIIGQGGSQDPNVLLENFLKRPPSADAFYENIGVKH